MAFSDQRTEMPVIHGPRRMNIGDLGPDVLSNARSQSWPAEPECLPPGPVLSQSARMLRRGPYGRGEPFEHRFGHRHTRSKSQNVIETCTWQEARPRLYFPVSFENLPRMETAHSDTPLCYNTAPVRMATPTTSRATPSSVTATM